MGAKKIVVFVAMAFLVVGIGVYLGRGIKDNETEESEGLLDEEPKPAANPKEIARKKRALSKERMEKAKALRALLQQSAKGDKAGGDLSMDPEELEDGELGTIEQHALTLTMETIYDPTDLKKAMEEGNVLEYMRESNARLAELIKSESLEVGGGKVPITEEMKLALERMRLLTRYSANIAHAIRPEDQLDVQNRHIGRINQNFAPRFDAFNEYYPFLDAQMIQP